MTRDSAETPSAHTLTGPLVLLILDGFGERKEREDNAVRLATTPRLDELFAQYPHTTIGTSGPDVGLPPGQMGNSEVGHLNFGAGRIAMMDISRIDQAIFTHTLGCNAVLSHLLQTAKARGGRLHLMGLLSDGGVHSSIAHLFALIDVAASAGVHVVIHAFLDGRDVAPGSAPGFLRALEGKLGSGVGRKGVIGTVGGRYYGMDRDERWERVEAAYQAAILGSGVRAVSPEAGVKASYAAGKTDEFVVPFCVADYAGFDVSKDVMLHSNFRPDRARQLAAACTQPGFSEFPRPRGVIDGFACMTLYDSALALPVAFPKESFQETFPEVLADAGMTQFRCAETEKYAHVTYFFNGGRETPFPGETRHMVPSPRDVATYDQKPEMSAAAVAAAVLAAIETGTYTFLLVNFANPDMVGHTGVLSAAVRAVEAVDAGVGAIADAVRRHHGALFVTSDHGNCEVMRDPVTGQPHTAHTTNRVPFLYINDHERDVTLRSGGRICDVAPTMLKLLGLPQPSAMSGVDLLAERSAL